MATQNPSLTPPPSNSRFGLVLTILGCTGIPAIALPFVEDVSPSSVIVMGEVREAIWIAVPFVLAPLVTVASFRQMARGGLSRPERVVAWTAAVVAAASYLKFFAWDLVRDLMRGSEGPASMLGMAALVGLILAPLSGLWLATWLRGRVAVGLPSIVAMQVVYVSNIIACVWLFHEFDYQAGAYCAIVAAAAFVAQAGITTWRGGARSRSG